MLSGLHRRNAKTGRHFHRLGANRIRHVIDGMTERFSQSGCFLHGGALHKQGEAITGYFGGKNACADAGANDGRDARYHIITNVHAEHFIQHMQPVDIYIDHMVRITIALRMNSVNHTFFQGRAGQ